MIKPTMNTAMGKKAQPGQSGSTMVEYSVVTLITVLVLFVPLPGLEDSLLNTMLSALRQFQANTTYLMSLP